MVVPTIHMTIQLHPHAERSARGVARVHMEGERGLCAPFLERAALERVAWARLAAHDDRLLRDELGNAEPKQFELDEVEANLAVLRALSSDESDDKADLSLCLHVKKTYVEMLPSEHPARAQYQ